MLGSKGKTQLQTKNLEFIVQKVTQKVQKGNTQKIQNSEQKEKNKKPKLLTPADNQEDRGRRVIQSLNRQRVLYTDFW